MKKILLITGLLGSLALQAAPSINTNISATDAFDAAKAIPKVIKETGSAVNESLSLVSQIRLQLAGLKASVMVLRQTQNPTERSALVLSILYNQLIPLLNNLSVFSEKAGKPLALTGEKLIKPFNKSIGTGMQDIGETTKELAKTFNELLPELRNAVKSQLDKALDAQAKAAAGQVVEEPGQLAVNPA